MDVVVRIMWQGAEAYKIQKFLLGMSKEKEMVQRHMSRGLAEET